MLKFSYMDLGHLNQVFMLIQQAFLPSDPQSDLLGTTNWEILDRYKVCDIRYYYYFSWL